MLEDNETIILKEVSKLRNSLIRRTMELIKIPTVNPPGEKYKECVDYLSNELSDLGVNVEIINVPEHYVEKYAPWGENLPRLILLGKLEGIKERPILCFNGHYDVVPAGSNWVTDPFNPVIRNERIYGRGATDMKGAIASIITAIEAIVNSGISLNGTILVSFVPDEETDGQTGSGYLMSKNIVKPNYCVVGEPSGISNIWIAHKGALWMEIKVYGSSAHGSSPWLGINAFEKVVKIVNEINKRIKPSLEQKISRYRTETPRERRPTITIGGYVKCGKAINIVPDFCTFTIDRRLIPEENVDDAENEILTLIEELKAKDPELKVSVRILSKFNACGISENHDLCVKLKEAIKCVLKHEPTLTMCNAGLDMRYFIDAGVPTIAYGPGKLSLAHSSNEYVPINDLEVAAKVYSLLILKILKKR